MISYDGLYGYFTRQTKVSKDDFPSTVEGQVNLIHDGIMEFNIRLRIGRDKLKHDDIQEVLLEDIPDEQLVFLSECMTLIIYKNMKTDFISTWESFQNDIGRKYYKDQLNGRERLVMDQEGRLDSLKLAIYDDFYTGM